jgi:hypothetical protein
MGFREGDYVRHSGQPNWGIGRVLSIGEPGKVTIFFLRGGRRIFYSSSPVLEKVADPGHPILEIAATANWSRADRNLYVVELDPKVFEKEERFAEANSHWIPGKLCVYVGMTGITPEERFQKHKSGHKAAWFVNRYGRRLLPEYYQHFNPLPYELGQAMEPELARQLRADGLGVWQN